MSADPSAYEAERAVMQAQVLNLLRKYGSQNTKPLAVIPTAERLYEMRIHAGSDSPQEARAWVIRSISRQLSGKPATYDDIVSSRFNPGDQTYVPQNAEYNLTVTRAEQAATGGSALRIGIKPLALPNRPGR